jgi:hypothetical protein
MGLKNALRKWVKFNETFNCVVHRREIYRRKIKMRTIHHKAIHHNESSPQTIHRNIFLKHTQIKV